MGEKFETLRRTYCSEECSEKAHKIHVKEISDQYYKDHREEIIDKVKERVININYKEAELSASFLLQKMR